MPEETRTSLEEEIAFIIDEDVMVGGSENGRLDQAEVLDKAHDVIEHALEWAYEKNKEEIREAMQKDGMKLITNEEYADFIDFVEKASDTIRYSVDADSWLENLEL